MVLLVYIIYQDSKRCAALPMDVYLSVLILLLLILTLVPLVQSFTEEACDLLAREMSTLCPKTGRVKPTALLVLK